MVVGQRRLAGDLQGYSVFGGSSVVVCEGPVLQRGGAWRRINGGGLWWRGEAKGEDAGRGESRTLWRAAISHLLTPANTGTHSSGDKAPPAAPPPSLKA